MKLKYYLRGLGIGVIFTALILSVGNTNASSKMTDAEVIERAKQLGMVEGSVLSEQLETIKNESLSETTLFESEESITASANELTDETQQSEETLAETSESQKTEEESETDVTEETKGTETIVDPKVAESAGVKTIDQELIEVVIPSGASSYTAALTLKTMGLVEDAEEYDTYLCQNGYDHYIRAGIFQIPENADEETIAKILTRMQ